jgi:hypothetical protein
MNAQTSVALNIKENFMAREFEAFAPPTEISVGDNNNTIVITPVQWRNLPDIDEVEQINGTDYAVLKELQAVLIKHNYTNRFGVTLLHKHFELEEDEVLMEKTDVSARISTLSVEKRDDSQNTIETMWKFEDTITGVTVCVQQCSYNRGHKLVHVKVGK